MQAVEQPIAEETNLTNKTEETAVYNFDQDPLVVSINLVPSFEKPVLATHKLRKPSFKEEVEREQNSPLKNTDIGKVDGMDASSMTIEIDEANCKLWDKIALSVSGYGVNGSKPSEDVSPDITVQTEDGEETVRNLIPSQHKSVVIQQIFDAAFDMDIPDENSFVFSLGGARTWSVVQKIGGQTRQSNGTLSDPDFQVRYTFKEPTELQLKKFRKDAIDSATMRDPKSGTTIDVRSTNLDTMRTLFDDMIKDIEGAHVGGVPVDVKNKEHLSKISASFKKGAILRLFNFLQPEIKN